MAIQIIELLTDDLTGGDAHETIPFSYDGKEYTIDLSTKNAAKLRKILAPYVNAGEKTTPANKKQSRSAPIEDTPAGRAMIRLWARTSGRFPNLADRGRIPAEVSAAYRKANRKA